MGIDFASVARLLANSPRSAMMDRLMDGTAASAGELATIAGVRASTASDHLAELQAGGLIVAQRQGRAKFFTIRNQDVATALESLALICPARPVRSLRQSQEASAMALFRTCYDHLAGSIAVALLDGFHRRQWVMCHDSTYLLSRKGECELSAAGVDLESARAERRTFMRSCLDWSERRPHLAGAVGAELARLFLAERWARRRERGRGLDLTTRGRRALREHFGIKADH